MTFFPNWRACGDDSWPTRLRLSLQESRLDGLPFGVAWDVALTEHPIPEDQPAFGQILPFVRSNFEAAYEGRSGRLGRLGVPTPDTSSAGLSVAHNAPRTAVTLCRSGSGCEQEAVEGERFCRPHLDELDAIRELPDAPHDYVNADERERLDRGRASAARQARVAA